MKYTPFRIRYIIKKLNDKKDLNLLNIKSEIIKSYFKFSLFSFFIMFFLFFSIFYFLDSGKDVSVAFLIFTTAFFSFCIEFLFFMSFNVSKLYTNEDYVKSPKAIKLYLEPQMLVLKSLKKQYKKELYVRTLINGYRFDKDLVSSYFSDKNAYFWRNTFSYELLYRFQKGVNHNKITLLKDGFFIRDDIQEYEQIQKEKKIIIMREKELLSKIKASSEHDIYNFKTNKENEFKPKVKKPESEIINL